MTANYLVCNIEGRDPLGTGSTRRGCLSPLSHRGLAPLIPDLTRDLSLLLHILHNEGVSPVRASEHRRGREPPFFVGSIG